MFEINTVKELFEKYKEPVMYLVFGGLTTLVNVVAYYLFYELLSVSNTCSTLLSWFLSVLFAFITNKLWVFESKEGGVALLREAASFFGCRAATGALDLLIMWLCVDILAFRAMICKIGSNVIVIILNYVFSKLIIFKKGENK